MARVWLVTGASKGFGRTIAEAALAQGDTVVAAVRRPESVADLDVDAVALDMTDPARIEPAVEEVLAKHGHVDVLVNNAGRGLVASAEDLRDDDLRALMELHFFGPVALTRALLPSMRARGSGTIVQMSSQGGRFSFPGVGAYSATKFALEGWSEALAAEVAPFGIRVLVVEPGAFRTSFNEPDALGIAPVSDAYQDIVGPVGAALEDANGQQPGDPVRAARAILTALDASEPPLRLPLGSDAVDAVLAHLDMARAEVTTWEHVSRATDFPA
jgi:NAD(P)-dependent dehydrogenase (short-subunit alcohol dehydrogenase family)